MIKLASSWNISSDIVETSATYEMQEWLLMPNDSLFQPRRLHKSQRMQKHISSKKFLSREFLKLNQLINDPSIWKSLFQLQASMPTILFRVHLLKDLPTHLGNKTRWGNPHGDHYKLLVCQTRSLAKTIPDFPVMEILTALYGCHLTGS